MKQVGYTKDGAPLFFARKIRADIDLMWLCECEVSREGFALYAQEKYIVFPNTKRRFMPLRKFENEEELNKAIKMAERGVKASVIKAFRF